MPAQLFDDLTLELPDQWELAERASDDFIQAFAPPTDHFRSSITLNYHPRQDDGEGRAPIDEFHEAQLVDMARTMTDAIVVDDHETEVAGCPARGSVVALRQGQYTLTAFLWTVEAPGAAVVLVGMTDIDQLFIDRVLFEDVLGSLAFNGGSAE